MHGRGLPSEETMSRGLLYYRNSCNLDIRKKFLIFFCSASQKLIRVTGSSFNIKIMNVAKESDSVDCALYSMATAATIVEKNGGQQMDRRTDTHTQTTITLLCMHGQGLPSEETMSRGLLYYRNSCDVRIRNKIPDIFLFSLSKTT